MRIRSPLITKFVGWMLASLLQTLFRTLRIKGYVEQSGTDPSHDADRSYIYSLWHDEIFIPLAMQDRARAKISALVSRHQDGSYLTEFMRHLSVKSLRGSSKNGGVEALRQLLQEAPGNHIFITPDGPRGPHHEMKEGIVYVASRSGWPIVLIASACDSAWYIRGKWTGLVVPKPFSRATYLLSRPLHIPADLSREELAWWRTRVQEEMVRLEGRLADLRAGCLAAPAAPPIPPVPQLIVRRAA